MCAVLAGAIRLGPIAPAINTIAKGCNHHNATCFFWFFLCPRVLGLGRFAGRNMAKLGYPHFASLRRFCFGDESRCAVCLNSLDCLCAHIPGIRIRIPVGHGAPGYTWFWVSKINDSRPLASDGFFFFAVPVFLNAVHFHLRIEGRRD